MRELERHEDDLLVIVNKIESNTPLYHIVWNQLDNLRCDMIEKDGIVEDWI